MTLKGTSIVCFATTLLLVSSLSVAQVNSTVFREAVTTLSSKDELSSIPIGQTLFAAFANLSRATDIEHLTAYDINIITSAYLITPPRDRMFEVYSNACAYLSNESSIDKVYLAQEISRGLEYERADRDDYYFEAYASLSDNGRAAVDTRIEALRGTSNLVVSNIDLDRLAQIDIDFVVERFAKYCDRLPGFIALDELEKAYPGGTSTNFGIEKE